MLDLSHVPSSQQYRQIFYAIGGSNSWQTWQKPRGAKMVQIMCVGAGGGGAGGVFNGTYSGWGGGGGASGGITKLLIPSFVIPNILYIQVGIGGIGGAGRSTAGNGLAGGKGTDSIISVTPTGSATLTNSVLCIAPGGNGATANNGGVSGGNGLGGTSTTYTIANAPFITLGLYTFEPTIAGKNANNGTVIPDVYALSNSVVTGGAGGGTTSREIAGNVYSASAFLLNDLIAPPQSTGLPSPNGYGIFSPIFCGTGGAGGNGNNAVNNISASSGGNGFIGCGGGGGGGGAASTVGSSGNGGNGGDGIVFITSIF